MATLDDTTEVRLRPSGRFVLRLDPDLHLSLREAAASAGMSLNSYCARKLASPGMPLDPPSAAIVRRAARVLGDSLLGVVAFGSWARGEASLASDLDVLLVTDDSVAVSRELYRRWDAEPGLDRDGHEVAPHFVRLPSMAAEASGFWAEVALDGLVLFERELVVSRRLAAVRRRVLRGELFRRVAGGHPYWVNEP